MLIEKFIDNIKAVLPITLIVLLLHFTYVPLSSNMLISFLIGSMMIIIGLSLFLVGIDLAITPLGSLTGSTLAKSNKLWIIIISGIFLGFFISIAEPGLLVFAQQVESVTKEAISSINILISVSVGLALLIGLGFVRIIYNIPLFKILIVLYGIIFVMALFVTPEFLAISFDASGATTGVLAVPFLLALSVGISKLKKDSKQSEKDAFGLVSIASTGAIMSLMVLNYVQRDLVFDTTQSHSSASRTFISYAIPMLSDTFMALIPLLVIFLLLNMTLFKLKKKPFLRILKGFVYAFIGLFIFLWGVNGGFIDIGLEIGSVLVEKGLFVLLILISFVLGLFTIVAEPAVFVLTQSIEDITAGYVKRLAVLIPLALGVGLAVSLSVLQTLLPPLQLWHYLLPGYLIALILMFFSPKLFVGIAFDAGGVATGPMTATFILAFTQGVAKTYNDPIQIENAFGMIALVALAPIITLQILGILYKQRSKKRGVPHA